MLDILISGGKLIDGTGAPWRLVDVGIAEGRIAAVGKLRQQQAHFHLPASGSVLCPGFIDAHSHADLSLIAGRWVDARLLQGITTEVVGQDGLSYAPVTEHSLPAWRRYLAALNGDFPEVDWTWRSVSDLIERYDHRAANAVYLLPHGAVRVEAMGWEPRQANEAEIATMRQLVRQGLREGAVGLSTGLTYPPCSHATTDELTALCTPVAEAGGILSIHLRSYGRDLLSALAEAIEIGRRSRVAVQISHLRGTESAEPNYAQRVLEQIEEARSRDVDVTFDTYPYTVGCGPLFSLLPVWAQHGGPDAVLGRLGTPSARERIVAEMAARSVDWSIYKVSNARGGNSQAWEAHTLEGAARLMKLSPPAFVVHLLRETELNTTIIAEGGKPSDNDAMLAHRLGAICSDGILVGGVPHPRGYGAFPRVFSRLVRDKRLLTWEEAVRKITSLPAARFNLQNRGVVREGAVADLVVFSPERIADGATYSNGRHPPIGLDWVLVNGHVVVEGGRYIGGEWGRALTPLLQGGA